MVASVVSLIQGEASLDIDYNIDHITNRAMFDFCKENVFSVIGRQQRCKTNR